MALAIRQNDTIRGIPIHESQLKISLLADDSTCFLDGSALSFDSLFDILNNFAICSGCKINLSKTEAIWIGAKKGCIHFPHSEKGLTWKSENFKTLENHFSLQTKLMFDLNYKESNWNKLKEVWTVGVSEIYLLLVRFVWSKLWFCHNYCIFFLFYVIGLGLDSRIFC